MANQRFVFLAAFALCLMVVVSAEEVDSNKEVRVNLAFNYCFVVF